MHDDEGKKEICTLMMLLATSTLAKYMPPQYECVRKCLLLAATMAIGRNNRNDETVAHQTVARKQAKLDTNELFYFVSIPSQSP